MEAENIDRPALPIDGIGHFDLREPGRISERGHDRADEPRVAFVQGSVEVAASPANVEVGPGIQRGEDPANGPDRERFEVSPFCEGNGRLGYTRPAGQVGL